MKTPNFAAQVSAECDKGTIDEPLWRKAHAEAGPDPKATRAWYIEAKAHELKTAFDEQQLDEYATAPRPWRRFWAKKIDLLGFTILAAIVVAVLPVLARVNLKSEFLIGAICLLLFGLYDAVVVALFGTTIGKTLLGISLTNSEGKRLGFSASLARSYRVLFQGLGFGLPIISMFTLLLARGRLKETGSTTWDEAGGHRVLYSRISMWKGMALALFFLAGIAVVIAGAWEQQRLRHEQWALQDAADPDGSHSRGWLHAAAKVRESNVMEPAAEEVTPAPPAAEAAEAPVAAAAASVAQPRVELPTAPVPKYQRQAAISADLDFWYRQLLAEREQLPENDREALALHNARVAEYQEAVRAARARATAKVSTQPAPR